MDIPAFSLIKFVQADNHIRRFIKQGDANNLGFKNITYLVAHDAGDGFYIQRFCHGFAHAVEDGQFIVALFGFSQQALGFVEQTGIFQGSAQRSGDGTSAGAPRVLQKHPRCS